MTKRKRSYDALLKEFKPELPRVARALAKAQKNRRDRLNQYFGGIRLHGAEELLKYLEAAEESCLGHKRLRKIAPLIGRVRCDFETALEATLSGFHAVAFDAMRDVMEIELLLTDFGLEPKRIDEWLEGNDRTWLRRFSPGVLRRRYAELADLDDVKDVPGYRDYKAHSAFLHVTPMKNPFGNRGLATGDEIFGGDACFWDFFEHAKRIVFLIHLVRKRLAPRVRRGPHPTSGLPIVREAWRSTQKVNQIFFLLLKASREKSEQEIFDLFDEAAQEITAGPAPNSAAV